MRRLVIAFFLAACGPAAACSCLDELWQLKRLEAQGFGGHSHAVFHGRVVKSVSSGPPGYSMDFEVQVVEAFQGQPGKTVRVTVELRAAMCGSGFSVEEEAVFFTTVNGSVPPCSKMKASSMNLERLRRVAKADSFPLPPGPPRIETCKRLYDQRDALHAKLRRASVTGPAQCELRDVAAKITASGC